MQAPSPHYLLLSDTSHTRLSDGRWRFILQLVGSQQRFTAADVEPGMSPGRLELLAVVRGLEALEGPSRVTLVTESRYVRHGMCRELDRWRDCGFRWERYGELVPIRDHDLWRRIDRALRFHDVECCLWHAGASDQQEVESAPFEQYTPKNIRIPGRAGDEHRAPTAA